VPGGDHHHPQVGGVGVDDGPDVTTERQEPAGRGEGRGVGVGVDGNHRDVQSRHQIEQRHHVGVVEARPVREGEVESAGQLVVSQQGACQTAVAGHLDGRESERPLLVGKGPVDVVGVADQERRHGGVVEGVEVIRADRHHHIGSGRLEQPTETAELVGDDPQVGGTSSAMSRHNRGVWGTPKPATSSAIAEALQCRRQAMVLSSRNLRVRRRRGGCRPIGVLPAPPARDPRRRRRDHPRSQNAMCSGWSPAGPISPRQVPITQSTPLSLHVGTRSNGAAIREASRHSHHPQGADGHLRQHAGRRHHRQRGLARQHVGDGVTGRVEHHHRDLGRIDPDMVGDQSRSRRG
jgi:hypothetical protein